MAQIQKHAGGGTTSKTDDKATNTSSFVEKPVDIAPVNSNQLTFNIDGQDHQINEADFNAIADKAFTNEVKKGQAKLRDRSKWMNAFQTKLQEAKTGKFNIQSSGDAVSSIAYTPSNASYDGSATDGLDANGNTAQRSFLGRTLAPRSAGNDDYISSILNNYIGEGVIQNRKSFLQTQKEKADASQATKQADYDSFLARDAESIKGASLGSLGFGKDWNDPEARKIILNKVWGKEVGHVAGIDNAFQKYVSKIYDPYYNGKEADYLKQGVDIKTLRDKFSSVYDPNTKTFKTPLKGINDLYRYADLLDTVGSDSSLFNKADYKSTIGVTPSTGAVGSNTASNVPATNAAVNDLASNNRTVVDQEGNVFKGSDGRYYADKALTRTITGKWTDGKYYSSGYLRSGKYAPTENGVNGKPQYNYYAPEAGLYAEGQKVDKGAYEQYINKLQTDPSKKADYDRIVNHNQNIDQTYAEANYVNKMTDGFLKDPNITSHGEYAFKNFGSTYVPAGAANITSMFTRGNAPVKGGIYNVQSRNENHLGLPDVETVVATDSGDNFRGIMRQDNLGKFKLYKRTADNKLIEDTTPKLQAFLNGLQANEAKLDPNQLGNVLLNRSTFNAPKFQLGGRIQKKASQISNSNQIVNHNSQDYTSTKAENLFKDGYKMSTQEKLEAGALAADLGGVVLSLTGAGSIAAGALGAAGTGAQLAADITRDGLDWGDAGRAAVGFGLDAASAIPGLGLIGKGSKTVNTIKKSAKWLIPVLAAAGAGKAVGLVTDIVSGKKSISDLNIDDIRAITNGVHGVIGGARFANNLAGTRAVKNTSLALKDGSIDLDPKQVSVLSSLDGEAKNTQAKLFAIENLAKKGTNVSDIDLKTQRDGFAAKTYKRWSPNAKTKEVVDLTTSKNGRELKNIEDYQGSTLKDKYMRWAIDKAAVRNPAANAPFIDGDRANQWGIFGDYTRGTVKRPQRLALPAAGETTGNLWLNETNTVARPGVVSESVVPGADLRGSQLGVRFNSLINRANAGKVSGDQMNIFKKGGIIKAQQGTRVPYLDAINPGYTWDPRKVAGLPPIELTPSAQLPFSSIAIPNRLTPITLPKIVAPTNTMGINISPTGNIWNKLKNLGSQINGNDISEFGRALATRGVNQRIDTRVEAPMSTAPAEVSIPIIGDPLKRNAYYGQANRLVQNTRIPTTSDAALYTAQNLAANGQAAQLRLQGDVINSDAIDRSRQMSLQNTMQNNAARTEVANRNIATLANSKQAERAANNQKLGMVAQPLLSFWENKNAENLRTEAYNKQIDGQIALSGLSSTVNGIKSPLMTRATELYTKAIDPKIPEQQRKVYMDQYTAVQKQLEGLGTAATNNALQLRKNLNYVAPSNYYSAYTKPLFAKGGMIEKQINKASNIAYKERLKDVRQETKEDLKNASLSLKQIQKLIDKALKIK